jgi:hypothetical protein
VVAVIDIEEHYPAEGDDTEQGDEYADEDGAGVDEPALARSGRRR